MSGNREAPVWEHTHQCQWQAGGQRCQYAGSISSNTLGGGPWYCRGHFFCDTQEMGMRIIVASMRPPEPSAARAAAMPTRTAEEIRQELMGKIRRPHAPKPPETRRDREPGEDG